MENLARGEDFEQQDSDRRTLDLDYIRRKIPIEEVASLLGIPVNRHFATCWRTENHKNGDANPSLHFLTRKNCAFCFHCDSRAMTNIDFVMAVRGCTFPQALQWFREQFGDLPTLRGRPAGMVRDKPFRVGVASPFEYFVRSGLYATLSRPAKVIYSVIRDLSDGDLKARIPYRTLRRHARSSA